MTDFPHSCCIIVKHSKGMNFFDSLKTMLQIRFLENLFMVTLLSFHHMSHEDTLRSTETLSYLHSWWRLSSSSSFSLCPAQKQHIRLTSSGKNRTLFSDLCAISSGGVMETCGSCMWALCTYIIVFGWPVGMLLCVEPPLYVRLFIIFRLLFFGQSIPLWMDDNTLSPHTL